MTTAFKPFNDSVPIAARHRARLDARESLQASIEAHASFPAGATFAFLIERALLEASINADTEIWGARISGANAGEYQAVPDVRKLATELGIPLPAAARS
jgi:hypothetical protein